MTTIADVKRKFAEWPRENWYGRCAGVCMTVCRHFGEINGAPYPSARAALEATRIESTDPTKAPAGAFHYWDYYGKGSQGQLGNFGHVGWDLKGAGTDVLNATSYPNDRFGISVGTSSVAQISSRVGKYRGWSRTYGRAHVARIGAPAPAGGGNAKPVVIPQTPKPTPIKKRSTRMLICHVLKSAETSKDPKKRRTKHYIFSDAGIVMEFTGDTAAATFAQQIGAPSARVEQAFINEMRARFK